MTSEELLKDYLSYLRLEKSLSQASIAAYKSDISKLMCFLDNECDTLPPENVQAQHLENFLAHVCDKGLSRRSQSRLLSSIKGFYKFLKLDEIIRNDPSELIESPNPIRKLPDVLSVEEIALIIDNIDLDSPEGHRNKAIVELLYGCGLRVSELVSFKISNYFPEKNYIKVRGKGAKERLIPLGEYAVNAVNDYLARRKSSVAKSDEDIMFLNRRGRKLSREMIFIIIKQAATKVGISKSVSPHTFRHSFATHLIENGADLRSVQEMLGHESIVTTEIYTHLDQRYLYDMVLKNHPRAVTG